MSPDTIPYTADRIHNLPWGSVYIKIVSMYRRIGFNCVV